MSFITVPQPGHFHPVTFNYLNQSENVRFDQPFDALFLESVFEIVTEFKGKGKDKINLLNNISAKIKDYHLTPNPVYWNSPIDDQLLDEFYDFCRVKKLDLPYLLEHFCIQVDDLKSDPELSEDAVIEVGGNYGAACVWQTAQRARLVITKILPTNCIHPNYTEYLPEFRAAIINPAITQGHDYLSNFLDYTFEQFQCFPVAHNDAMDIDTNAVWDINHHIEQLKDRNK